MANTVINTPELLNLDSTTGATILAKGTISERPATPTFSLDYLVVAGGGGGGGGVTSESPGAGGAGTVIYQTAGLNVIPSSEYTLYIADGGTGGGNNSQGTNGQDSYISFNGSNVVLAKGGGGGGSYDGPGLDGGSGGGGTRDGDTNSSQSGGNAVTTNIAPAGASIYGNNGASGDGSCSGGGGGAGAVGTAPSGGDGVQINIDGNNYFWGGGGGACGSSGTGGQGGGGGGPRGGQGGTGGINPGASTSSSADGGGNAGVNTGGGGGGATNPTGYPGGTGGSGIIILRYPNNLTLVVGSGSLTTGQLNTAIGTNEKYTSFTDGTGTISFSGTVVGGDNDATDGALRFNTDTNKTEYFDGTGWYEIVDEYASGFVGPGTNYFDTKLYTGNGTNKSISTLNFAPGLTWVKARDAAHDHVLVDSVNGAGSNKGLSSNATYYEGQYTATYGYISSLDSNGFTVSAGSSYANYTNVNNEDYVSWNWKAGGTAVAGTGSGVTNVLISANRDAGFSIVKYTGGNSASDTVNHGLTDAEMIILKDLSDGTHNWRVWQKDLTANNWLYLNLTNAQSSAAVDGGIRNVDSNSFGFINGTTQGVQGVNNSSNNYIAYVWKSIAGYSSIGSYSGTSGNKIVYTTDDGTSGGSNPFQPSFVMIKKTNSSSNANWVILDAARGSNTLFPDLASSEDVRSGLITYNSDNFTLTQAGSVSQVNNNGDSYLYMAFA